MVDAKEEWLKSFASAPKRGRRVTEEGVTPVEDIDVPALPPEKILKLKPTNSSFTDGEWLVTVGSWGLAGAYSKMFMEYVLKKTEKGEVPQLLLRKEVPGMFQRVYFGEAGAAGYEACGGDLRRFTEFMERGDWRPEQLGWFGRWVKEANIHQRYIRPTLSAYLRD